MRWDCWLGMAALWAAGASVVVSAEWPTYRGDCRRSGYSSEELSERLSLNWQYTPRHRPQPAWSDRDTRMPFDRAPHPVISGGRLFFGSSADCKVYALDASSGEELWSFFCDGPVRFAPVLAGDRLFVASDDGHLYCLSADRGRQLWRIRGGPGESRVLGNDRLISRWPARGGPVVADGVVYFGAGIWPSEGIYLYALDAESGRTVWCNDSSGGISMPQPHPGANAASGVSAQGYLAISGDLLLVPTGRAVPAAFDRRSGQFRYFHLQQNGKLGGSEITAAERWFLNSQSAFDLASGARHASFPKLAAPLTAITPRQIVHWQSGKLDISRSQEKSAPDRRGAPVAAVDLEPLWSAPCPHGGNALIVAGAKAVSAGLGPGGFGIDLVDLEAREPSATAPLEEEPLGLAAAAGRLYVAAASGTILCFGEPGGSPPKRIRPEVEAPVFENQDYYDRCAAEVLQRTGVAEGYCIDLDCGSGGLAYALARQSNLRIVALGADPDRAGEARRRFDEAGLYGERVTLFAGNDPRSLPDYLGDLVVCGRSAEGAMPASRGEVQRILRPFGGVACFGRLGAMEIATRGPLAGSGDWTHQYCDPANSNCSSDTLLSGRLGVLWFNDLAFPVPSRHGRGRAPLFFNGRLFIQGLDGLLCVNAYNGRKLWEYPLPGIQQVFDGEHLMGTSGTGGNYCVGPAGLYIHTGRECLRIDPASGALIGRLRAPDQPDGSPGAWGIVALSGNTLFGTLADTRHLVTFRYREGDMSNQFTEAMLLFAMDAVTGGIRWRYQPEHSIRHNAIAIGDGRVHLIDRPIASGDRHREKRVGKPDPEDVHPPGKLVALDAKEGRTLWSSDDQVYGTTLALSEEHDLLLMCYQDWRFKLASELGGRMAAFDSATGERRWDVEAGYQGRPVINGRAVYLQPGAWDLATGKRLDFALERSYGCGILSGCKNMLVYRSAVVGYVDLQSQLGTQNYGGIRPGCWINAVPAGGLVLMPDATDRCTCSYLNKASIALGPLGPRPPGAAPHGAARDERIEVH